MSGLDSADKNSTFTQNGLEGTACRRCGVIAQHRVAPGRGPHHAGLRCEACDAHIRWVSENPPEERARRAAQCRDRAMGGKPPTPRQLEFLKMRGYAGPMPKNRLETSRAIDEMKSKQR